MYATKMDEIGTAELLISNGANKESKDRQESWFTS